MHSILLYISPWEFSPTVFLTCAAAGLAYALGLRALKAQGKPLGFWQPFAFFLGLTLDYAMLQSYCDYLSQHMFWVHRLQHLVLHHLAPVLLVLAAPGPVIAAGLPSAWLARGRELIEQQPFASLTRLAQQLFRIVQNPLIAPVLFVGLIFFWLNPAVHFGAMLDIDRYRAMNWGMAVDGILFWWLMLAPRRAQGRAAVGYPTRILIVCLVALPQILLGAYIALHSTVLFDVYAVCGRAWNLSPLTDQELGGLLTWIPAAMMSGVAMLVILRRLLIEEGEKTPSAPRSEKSPSTPGLAPPLTH
jgi:putative membrane protein